jgi:hypothetical protein
MAGVRVLCLLIVLLMALNSVAAQDIRAGGNADHVCRFEENKAFARRPIPSHQITTKFLTKPHGDADVDQIKKHFIYSAILGRFAAAELSKSSLRQCSFGSTIDPSLDLYFELFSIGQNVHNECSLSRCARSLSDLLQSANIDQQAFQKLVDAIVKAMRRSDSPDPRYLRLGLQRATVEAYRHIYSAGTKERIFADLSPQDFQDIGFDEFISWFKRQQNALRKEDDKAPSLQVPSVSVLSPAQIGDAQCAPNPDVRVEELNIDRQGWGQKSIILINHGYKADGLAGIDNAALRAICPPGQNNLDAVDALPWRDMAGQISCHRERMNRDRWLIVFSKEEPVKTSADMRRYAQAIAQALKADRCVHPELRMFVVNFLQQR